MEANVPSNSRPHLFQPAESVLLIAFLSATLQSAVDRLALRLLGCNTVIDVLPCPRVPFVPPAGKPWLLLWAC